MLTKILIICIILIANVPQANATDDFETLLGRYKTSQQTVLDKIEKVHNNPDGVIAAFNEIRKLSKLVSKEKNEPEKAGIQNDLDAAVEALMENYGEVLYLSLFLLDTDPEKATKAQLVSIINKGLELYRNSLSCFDKNKYANTPSCKSVEKACNAYGYRDGVLHTISLTENLDKDETDVTDVDPGMEGLGVFGEGLHQFCKLRGMIAPYEALNPRESKATLVDFYVPRDIRSALLFRKKCIEAAPSAERELKFLQLEAKYPGALSHAKENFLNWQLVCNNSSKFHCSSSYIVKDQVIYSYVTENCTVREVTKQDIENDLATFSSDAIKLKHSTLIDDIELCQQAYNAGFTWAYSKPELPKTCTGAKKILKKRSKK